ncbi:MAG: VWA domain-containing protein, partial [Gammaproteobacteria bacterium]|nr:VWA domain-containing protein [Gammaproteobacteria bacterium]
MMSESFHFLRPEWFLALIPLLLILLLSERRRRGEGQWQQVCDAALLPYILIRQKQGKASALPRLWLLLMGLIAVTALAGPVWERTPQPLFRSQEALVVLFDLSRSMDATDLRPSRLERARLKLLDLLHQRQEGLTALITYAAQPFVVTPLTEDSATIEALVRSLSTDIMPAQGSRPDLAIAKGVELLQQA